MHATSPVDITAHTDRSRLSPLQQRVILLCLALGISDGFNSLAVGYAIPSLSESWDVTPGRFAAVISAAVVGEILASVTLAPLADRFGRKPIITLGILLFSVSTLAAAWATSVETLLLLRFVSGIGIGTASPNIFALGSEYSPSKFKSTAVSAIGTGMAAGGALCGLLAAWLIPAHGGTAVFLAAGVIPLVVLLAALPLLPDSVEHYRSRGRLDKVATLMNKIEGESRFTASSSFEPSTRTRAMTRPTELFSDGRAVATAMAWTMLLLSIVGSYFVFSYLATVLILAGVPEATAILATSVTTFGGILGGVLLGVLVDRSRFGPAALLVGVLTQVGATVALVASLSAGAQGASVIALCLVLGAGIIGTGVCMTALVAQVYPPELRGTGIGWAAGFSRIGAIVAPLVAGACVSSGWSPSAILFASLVPAIANGVLLLVFSQLRLRQHGGRADVVANPAVLATPEIR